MSINLSALMKQRYDTAANWTAQNTTLLAGEIGIESDTKKWKVGTGSTAWTSLVYAIGGTYPIVNADVAAAAAIAYSKLATLISGNIVLGSAANVATSTAVTGDVTISSTGVTAIAAGVIVNADINASAAIVDTKLATIATAGKVSNSATTAASANTPSAIVARDPSNNFTAGTITAALTGAASSNVLKAGDTMTGVLAVTAGTAALPGIAVSGDLNTGIYSPGTDQLAISTGGTGRLFVTNNGVGTGAAPQSGYGGIQVRNSFIYINEDGADTVQMYLRTQSSEPAIQVATNHPFKIQTNNAERMRLRADGTFEIKGAGTAGVSPAVSVNPSAPANSAVMDSLGRLGLGTSGPGALLNLSATFGTTLTTGLRIDGLGSTTNNVSPIAFYNQSSDWGTQHAANIACGNLSGTGGGGYLRFSTSPDGNTAPSEKLRITAAGLVGIGTTDVRQKLTFGTTTASLTATPECIDLGATYSNSAGANMKILTYNDGATKHGIGVSAASSDYLTAPSGAHVFYRGTTEVARFDSSSRLLVGTTVVNPHASGTYGIELNPTDGLKIGSNNIHALIAARWNGNGEAIRLQRDNTTVGTISVTTTATTYNTSSDYRLKENVTPVHNGITRLLQLKPSRFNFIADPNHTVDGFLAHEAQAVVPECVTGEKDAVDDDGNPVYQGIDQSKLVPLLTAALQEAIAKIESLETRLSALEAA